MQLKQHQALEMLTAKYVSTDLENPIDFLFVEHLKHRILCWIVDQIANEIYVNNETIMAAIFYLDVEYKIHIDDEEIDLFPSLLRRAKPEDELEEIVTELIQEHAADKKDAVLVVDCLRRVIENRGGRETSRAARSLLRRFSANERQHLIVENGIVLPLARVRLQRDDLAQISAGMAERRNQIRGEDGQSPGS